MAFGECVLLVHKIDSRFAVHFDDNVIADGGDLLGEPLIGFDEHITDRDKVVKTAGPDRVRMSAVNLGFVTFGEAGSVLSAEILAAVAVVVDLSFDSVNEVLIVAALAKQVPRFAG